MPQNAVPSRVDVYGQASILISELIGRAYNNPLGEYPFDRFGALFAGGKQLLDIGAGRGRGAILAARRFGTSVVGIEPSVEMTAFAQRLVDAEGLQPLISLLPVGFLEAPLREGDFDLAICFDVLSYFDDKPAFFAKTAKVLRRPGHLLFSDYFCSEQSDPRVLALTKAWGIALPGTLDSYPALLKRHGFTVSHFEDTTKTYYEHWSRIRARCEELRPELVAKTSPEAVERYVASVDSILQAVETGHFGHLFCVVSLGG
ncbi:MAG: methyltransferase domain-containing protein [Oligoflexia bacterium]|nr:methyltransferase domain-containing protein [Oligoflexia bacterium]